MKDYIIHWFGEPSRLDAIAIRCESIREAIKLFEAACSYWWTYIQDGEEGLHREEYQRIIAAENGWEKEARKYMMAQMEIPKEKEHIESKPVEKEVPKEFRNPKPKKQLALFAVLVFMLFSCGIASVNQYYNALEPRNLIILDKRFVPGFTGVDRFLLKVREGNEYRWLQTSSKYYSTLQIGDTLKTTLIVKL